MGVVLPGWADEVLDLIGVSWPNVDEDDYRQMAQAMREFADEVDDGVTQAHNAVQRVVSAGGGGLATEALNAHWGKIKDGHLTNLAGAGRLSATAMEGVAFVIEGAKIAALVQLGILAAEIAAAAASAPFTLGLSSLAGVAATQATRLAVRRILREAAQYAVEEVVNIAMGPVYEALGSMAGDLVIQLGANAAGVQHGVDLDRTAAAGKDGLRHGADGTPMELLSAGGTGGSGAAGGFSFDPEEYDRAQTTLHGAGSGMRDRAGGSITRARGHHGRTRGKDPIADAANAMLDQVINGIEKGVKTSAKHLDENMTRGLKQMATNHGDNDRKLSDHFSGIGKKDGSGQLAGPHSNGGSGGTGPSARPSRGRDSIPPNTSAQGSDGSPSLRAGVQDEVAKSKPMDGRCKGGDPIDMVSGEMLMEHTDVDLPGLLPLVLRRTHVSTYRWGRWYGPSWASTLDQRLELDESGVVLATEDAMLLTYPVPQPRAAVFPTQGPRWPMEWDGVAGGQIRISDPLSGYTRHFSPAPTADEGRFLLHIVAITDRNGHRVDIDYTPEGAPTAVRHSGGYHLAIDTADQRVTRLRLHSSEHGDDGVTLLQYGYTDGHLSAITDSRGQARQYTYDEWARITAWTDRNGSCYRYTYDQDHRVIAGEGSDGFLNCAIVYDTENRTTAYTDSLGRVTLHRYNELLQRTSVTDPLGHTTHTGWDRHNRLVSRTNVLGHTTRYTYDAAGNLTVITRPDGEVTTAEYNALGLPVQVVEPDGATWRYTYDDRGNRLTVTDPAGASTCHTYDEAGRPVSVTDALGHTRRVVTDGAGLPLQLIDALGYRTVAERDAFGRVRTLTDSAGRIERFGWTIEGKPAWRERPETPRASWSWDGEGNLVSHTDSAGNTTRYTFTHFHQVASRTTPDGHTHAFGYDTEVNLTSVTSPQGQQWCYTYDPAGRLIAERDFNDRSVTYAHDPAGNLASRTGPDGTVTTFVRDIHGRPVEQHMAGEIARFTYDLAGSLVTASNADTTVIRTYDILGRTLAETINQRTTTFTYDLLGRRTSRRTPSGIVSRWSYDAAGRPAVLDAAGHQLAFTFDATGRELARQLSPDTELTQDFDAAGRLTCQTITHGAPQMASPTIKQQRTYSYRADGHLTEVSELTDGTRRFDLHPQGRVTAVHAANWSETYAYDSVGNLTHADTPPPNPLGTKREFTGTRLRRAGGTTYEYNDRGQPIRTVKRLLNGQRRVHTYTWNAEGRLTGTTTPDGTRWRYHYDPSGRRTSKQRLTTDGRIAQQTLFTWDGTRLAEQITSTGRSTSWDYLPGSHRPLTQIDTPTTTSQTDPHTPKGPRFHAIVTDLAGTPTELLTPEGEVAWKQRTTLWGLPLAQHDNSTDCPLRFPGQYADEETGWNYNYFRHYDPETARYVTPDPLGLGPDPNDYAYVAHPLHFSDPLGLARVRGAGGRWERDPNSPPQDHSRDTEYPSSYRQSTHDHMAAQWTDEGIAQGGTPVYQSGPNAGMIIPRDELTWRNSSGEIVPSNELTYEHLNPVVEHWNQTGYNSDRATRNDFYNDTNHMEPMTRSENSRGGALMDATYRQDVGPNYSCG